MSNAHYTLISYYYGLTSGGMALAGFHEFLWLQRNLRHLAEEKEAWCPAGSNERIPEARGAHEIHGLEPRWGVSIHQIPAIPIYGRQDGRGRHWGLCLVSPLKGQRYEQACKPPCSGSWMDCREVCLSPTYFVGNYIIFDQWTYPSTKRWSGV